MKNNKGIMGRPPGYLVSKYTIDILNDIGYLNTYIDRCNPKAIIYSAKILTTSKEALERNIIDKDRYDEWLLKVENLNKMFVDKCSCLEKIKEI